MAWVDLPGGVNRWQDDIRDAPWREEICCQEVERRSVVCAVEVWVKGDWLDVRGISCPGSKMGLCRYVWFGYMV